MLKEYYLFNIFLILLNNLLPLNSKPKSMKSKFIVCFALLALFISSCAKEDNTITDIASKDSNLSSLVAALNKAGLAETLKGAGPYTVFAPSNDAFTAFLNAKGFANLEAVPTDVLKEILLNHVLNGSTKSTALTNNMYVKTLAKGSASSTNTLSMHISTASGVKLNGVATVTKADIEASNGVIHLVDKVIDLPTVVTHATANTNFTSLVGALTGAGQPDFVSILSGTGPFTVFAPTNDAFTAFNTELAGGIAGVSAANLTKVLQYHVVGANVLSSSLTEGQVVTTITSPAQTFTVQLTGGAKVKDASDRISTITATDVQCANGVIHVVNKVFLPKL